MFDIRKATHVAAYLLWKRGRRMSSLKLMKMMYIAEKQFLLQYGERLTGDKMVSMPYGPVLSATYDCFMGDREYWDSWIINPGNYDLALNSSIKQVWRLKPVGFSQIVTRSGLLSRMGKPPRIILSHPHQIPPYEKRQNQGGNGCYSGKD